MPNWQFRRFAQVHQGEFPCHPPSPRLAPIPPLSARYPVKGSLRRFAPLTAQAFAAPGRCDGGSGGNDNSRGFFKFGQDDKAFGKWRQGRLSWLSSDASKRFLRVHNHFSSLLEHNALVDLMPTVLYELAAPSTPESAVVEIISRAQVK